VKNTALLFALLLITAIGFAQTKPDIRNIFDANDRVSVHMPENALLGQPFELRIDFTDMNVKFIAVTQADGYSELKNSRNDKDISNGTVVRDDGSTKTIEIIPLGLGTINIQVLAIFEDGGFCRKEYKLHVKPSSKGLQRFYLHEAASELPLVMEEKESDRQRSIDPTVRYYGLDSPIYFSASELKLTVLQPKENPVIRLEPNGIVHALRPGKAKISADFDGVAGSVTAVVYGRHKAPSGIGMNYCEATFTQDFQTPTTGPSSQADQARRTAQKQDLRAFLWRNWIENRRACAAELIFNHKGDSFQREFEFELDDKGVRSIYGYWLQYTNWKPSEGEFRAYSISRVIRESNRDRVLKDDEKHTANDYVLTFKDESGKTILTY
jgi:hypothetical protein